MKIAAIKAFCAFAVYGAICSNSYAEQPAGEQKTEKQPIEWGFACVPLKDFAKAQAGTDEVRFNNFMVTEGFISSEPKLPMSTLEINFNVTNRTSNNVYWSAEFLGFSPEMLPTFVASATPTWGHTGPNKIETLSTRVRLARPTLAGTEQICLRINSH